MSSPASNPETGPPQKAKLRFLQSEHCCHQAPLCLECTQRAVLQARDDIDSRLAKHEYWLKRVQKELDSLNEDIEKVFEILDRQKLQENNETDPVASEISPEQPQASNKAPSSSTSAAINKTVDIDAAVLVDLLNARLRLLCLVNEVVDFQLRQTIADICEKLTLPFRTLPFRLDMLIISLLWPLLLFSGMPDYLLKCFISVGLLCWTCWSS
ncbi:unnamed protein product [Penicillium bialowiezense]